MAEQVEVADAEPKTEGKVRSSLDEQKTLRRLRSVHVSGLRPRIKQVDILNYFSKFGKVENVYIMARRKNVSANVVFTSVEDVNTVLTSSHCIDGKAVSVESRRPWKPFMNRRLPPWVGRKQTIPQYDYVDFHQKLMTQLQQCSTVSEQVTKLCSMVCQVNSDSAHHQEVLHDVENVLKMYYPDCGVSIYGSCAVGFASGNYYLDLNFEPLPNYSAGLLSRSRGEGDRQECKIPSVSDLEQHTVSEEDLRRLPPHVHLELIGQILKLHPQLFGNPSYVSQELGYKFYHKKNGIDCDITCSNRPSLCSTEWLKFYAAYDERFVPLMVVLHYWAKFRVIKQRRNISSYAFSLLIVFFLQNTDPPVLPTLQELQNTPGQKATESWEYGFCSDVKKVAKSENTQPVDKLITEFFDFYANFDFANGISSLTGQKIDRSSSEAQGNEEEKVFRTTALCVEDPFNPGHTAMPYVRMERMRILKHAARKASKCCHCSSTSLAGGGWGIMKLFESKKTLFSVPTKFIPKRRDCVMFTLEFSKQLQRRMLSNPGDFYLKFASLVEQIFSHGLMHETEIVDMLYVKPQPKGSAGGQVEAAPPAGELPDKENAIKPESPPIKAGVCDSILFSASVPNFMPIKLLSLQCTVLHNTWHARRQTRRSKMQEGGEIPEDNTACLLDVEHTMSAWLMEDQQTKLKNPWFFLCDCYLSRTNKQDRVTFLLSPYEGFDHFPPFGYFLKAFLIRLLEESLSEGEADEEHAASAQTNGIKDESMAS